MQPIWIIIPGQAFDKGKTRLSPLLDAPAREQFSRQCLRHVVRTARHVVSARRIIVVSRSANVLGMAKHMGVVALRERGGGLNNAVTQASAYAIRRGAAGTLVLHADLPLIGAREISGLVTMLARHLGVVLAPDAAHQGSNALGVRPAGSIRYCFGPGSFAKHRSQAHTASLQLRLVDSPGLAHDVDTPTMSD